MTVLARIGEFGGEVVALDAGQGGGARATRDITVAMAHPERVDALRSAIDAVPGARVVAVSDHVFLAHLGGKIGIALKREVRNREDLATVYTPGVGRVCEAIARDPDLAYNLTMKRNSVAIVTDGSAVLGLGHLGPKGALPVMEGKAMLFKRFADIDAFPVCLDVHGVEEIVTVTAAIAPQFGGINLEDIAAPACFEIEEELRRRLDIPVFHDDQHGTAIVVLAALNNALRVVGKELSRVRAVVSGAGAAGVAVTKILLAAGIGDVVVCDRHGVLAPERADLTDTKRWVAEHTNRSGVRGGLAQALRGADVFVGVSAPGLVHREDVAAMAARPVVFALANPVPEVMPEEVMGIAAVMATGRSDFPNQVNNALAFPGVFRGALDSRARAITDGMNVAAAGALAAVVGADQLSEEYIIPSVFQPEVVDRVAAAVREAAVRDGVARVAREVRATGLSG
ncbi:MAG: NAD-dependent malic enzyme [Firmicutes bacterium]|nr:NAD-dependent malic enzyme [Bacillota bacterium]